MHLLTHTHVYPIGTELSPCHLHSARLVVVPLSGISLVIITGWSESGELWINLNCFYSEVHIYSSGKVIEPHSALIGEENVIPLCLEGERNWKFCPAGLIYTIQSWRGNMWEKPLDCRGLWNVKSFYIDYYSQNIQPPSNWEVTYFPTPCLLLWLHSHWYQQL